MHHSITKTSGIHLLLIVVISSRSTQHKPTTDSRTTPGGTAVSHQGVKILGGVELGGLVKVRHRPIVVSQRHQRSAPAGKQTNPTATTGRDREKKKKEIVWKLGVSEPQPAIVRAATNTAVVTVVYLFLILRRTTKHLVSPSSRTLPQCQPTEQQGRGVSRRLLCVVLSAHYGMNADDTRATIKPEHSSTPRTQVQCPQEGKKIERRYQQRRPCGYVSSEQPRHPAPNTPSISFILGNTAVTTTICNRANEFVHAYVRDFVGFDGPSSHGVRSDRDMLGSNS